MNKEQELTLLHQSLEEIFSATQKLSETLRQARILCFATPLEDEKRLVDVQRVIDLASEMIYVESKIIFCEICELQEDEKRQARNFNKVVKDYQVSEDPSEVYERWKQAHGSQKK